MKVIIRLIKELKIVKIPFAISLIGIVFFTFVFQYSITIIQKIIDDILGLYVETKFFNHDLFNRYMLIFISVALFSELFSYLSSYLMTKSVNKVVKNIRDKLFDKINKVPISFFDDKSSGRISTIIVNNTQTLSEKFYFNLISQVITNFIKIITIYFIIIKINLYVGLIMLLMIPVTYLWQKIYVEKTNQENDIFYQKESDVNSILSETLSGIETIQVYDHTKEEEIKLNIANKEMYDSNISLLKKESLYSWGLFDLIRKIFVLIIVTYVCYNYIFYDTDIKVGVLFIMINYIEELFFAILMIIQKIPDLQKIISSGKRVLELLDSLEIKETDSDLLIENGDVEFKDVTFAYKKDISVLKDVSFKVKSGEMIGFVGATGSGKSSIINLLFKFYTTSYGKILIDNVDIHNYNSTNLRKRMAIVLQEPYLFKGTIASNIKMGNDKISDFEVEKVLFELGAELLLKNKGINYSIEVKGKNLSSGERQLISFARAIISKPKILILDEATSNIDSDTEMVIQNAIKIIRKKCTIFVVAHRLSTIFDADKIFVLDKGKIIESGSHDELILIEGKYKELYNQSIK